jgi:hypothetical protein
MPGQRQAAGGSALANAVCAAAGKDPQPAPLGPRASVDDPALAEIEERLGEWERLLAEAWEPADGDSMSAEPTATRKRPC